MYNPLLLKDKLCLLAAEYDAGNTTTRNEIVAILDRLRAQNFIAEEEYDELNDWLDRSDGSSKDV